MRGPYRLYRQDVISELSDGGLVYNTSYIDGDLPSSGDDIVFVELDGSERPVLECHFELILSVLGPPKEAGQA